MAGLILVFVGLFSVIGAAADLDFYMEHRKARFMTAILGRMGARVFYCVTGLAMIIGGLAFAANGAG